jgi:hypothetical protein
MRYLLFLLFISACAQKLSGPYVTVDGRFDASTAIWTKPIRSAAANPATCSFPELYANSVDGLIYRCKVSPPNTWEAVGSGGTASVAGLYTGALNFSSTIAPGVCTALTYTATGLAAGSALATGTPTGLAAGLRPRYIASAADTVQVQLCNDLDTDQTPGSLTFSVRDATSLGYISGSASISWSALVPGQCSTNTITVTGAAAGDNVLAGWPATLPAGLDGYMRVTAADTVTAELCNRIDATISPPTSVVYKAAITR